MSTENLRVAMSHAGQWVNTARRVLAHVRAYLDSGQYSERRDNEHACESVSMATLHKTGVSLLHNQFAIYG